MDMKTALIVGTGPGLSASLARLFTKHGLQVAMASRDPSKLAKVEKGDLAKSVVATGKVTPIALPLKTSFQHVIRMRFARHLLHRFVRPLVLHGRASRNDAQMLGRNGAEPGDHLRGQSIAQIVLAAVSAQVFKRDYQDGVTMRAPARIR